MAKLLLVAALLALGLGAAAEERRVPRPPERTRESPEPREDEPTRGGRPPTIRNVPLRSTTPAPEPTGRMPTLRAPSASPDPGPPGTVAITTPAIEVIGFSPPAPTGTFEVTTPPIEVVGFSPPAPKGTFSIQTAPIEVIGFPQKSGSIPLEAPGTPTAPLVAPALEEKLP